MTQAYGVVLDAGSTGTRTHVYTWPSDHPGAIAELSGSDVDKLELGIAAFAPADVDKYLAPLLARATALVPTQARPRTSIFVFATAGMRMLPAEWQQQIWAAVRVSVRTRTTFRFLASNARTISGNYEGIYAWLSTRHLVGRSGGGLGALDLGGDSTQMAFAPVHRTGTILQDAYLLHDGVRVYSSLAVPRT